jgi:hypothetical protein
MFSDLVGSTALSARMDPEDLHEVISAYQKCVAETVGRFGGFVAEYMGDGVLIYFGYPQAHEDDAERAVRTGLELVAAASALKTHAALQTRVSGGQHSRLDSKSSTAKRLGQTLAVGEPRRASCSQGKAPHSVFTGDLIDAPGQPTRRAVDEVIAFFRKALLEQLPAASSMSAPGHGGGRHISPTRMVTNLASLGRCDNVRPLMLRHLRQRACDFQKRCS